MASLNIKRLERDIEKYIPVIIQRELTDENFKTVTITGCKLSHDMGYCKVFFTSYSLLTHEQIQKELNTASPVIRGKLAKLIKARITPTLDFRYDTSIEYANNIENIIKKIHE